MSRPPRRRFLVRQARRSKGKRSAVSIEDTVHYWWWQFLRRNTDYIHCCESGGKGRLSKLFADFGDVRADDYHAWLKAKMPSGETRKEYLFAEAENPLDRASVVTLASTADWDQDYEDHGYLLVAINMREPTLGSLRKKFDQWLKTEPMAPNTLSPDERRALVDRRRYEYVMVNGKRVRRIRDKGLPAELRMRPLPRRQRLAGRRGRRPLAVYQDVIENGQLVRKRIGTTSTARYPLWQNYAVDNLRDMLAVVDAVDAAERNDRARKHIKSQLIPLRKRLVKIKHYKAHKLIAGRTADEQRVKREFDDIYQTAQAVIGESLVKEAIEVRLEDAWANRRNKETTTYPEIGLRLMKELGWQNKDVDRNRWLTKKLNELYTRGKAVIANTAQGKFPKDE